MATSAALRGSHVPYLLLSPPMLPAMPCTLATSASASSSLPNSHDHGASCDCNIHRHHHPCSAEVGCRVTAGALAHCACGCSRTFRRRCFSLGQQAMRAAIVSPWREELRQMSRSTWATSHIMSRALLRLFVCISRFHRCTPGRAPRLYRPGCSLLRSPYDDPG